MIRVVVQEVAIDVAAVLEEAEGAEAGAVASFTGIVRDDGGVSELFLEHYPGVTKTALRTLAEEAAGRWPLTNVIVVHRVGAMVPGDRIVLVVTASTHREAALAACAFLIDRLKTEAPFWKRERRGMDQRWVEARSSDDAAAARWLEGAASRPASGQDAERS